jgi:hypothetical protein
MAMYVLMYLMTYINAPLVLGGNQDIRIISSTDASYGTAPKGRSISGHLIRLNDISGVVLAKSKANTSVLSSSFDAELDGTANAIKSISRINNIMQESSISTHEQPLLWGDNESMIDFVVNAKKVAKGVRHMELRQWYIREKLLKGDVNMEHMSGKQISADKLTKLADKSSQLEHVIDIMGLKLLNDYTEYILPP